MAASSHTVAAKARRGRGTSCSPMELGAKRQKAHYLPQFERIINSTQVPVSERPAIGNTTGKDAQGQYNTARLKEYPSQLCRGFALSFHDAAMSRVASDPDIRELDGGLLAEHASMVLSEEQGPEFAG